MAECIHSFTSILIVVWNVLPAELDNTTTVSLNPDSKVGIAAMVTGFVKTANFAPDILVKYH